MSILFKEIAEKEYISINCTMLFESNNYNRKFGLIADEKREYKFAWRSELIKPDFNEIAPGIIYVGIDQNFAVIDFQQDKILVNKNLLYSFLTVKQYEEYLFVITELEIIKLNKVTFKQEDDYDLPDLFEDMIFDKKQILVRCAENFSKTIYL